MKRAIQVGNDTVIFKATAATTIIYEDMFGQDMIKELSKVEESIKKKNATGEDYASDILKTFLQLAYVMAKQADPSIPGTAVEWLDSFDVFPMNDVFPQIMRLWQDSTGTQEVPKKVQGSQVER